jgi:hypothetical protein
MVVEGERNVNNSEAMTKAIDTGGIATGVLNPEQARAFVTQVFEATPMLSAARRVAMGARKMNVDKLGVGSRVLRRRFEGVAVPGSAGVATSQIQLDAVGLSLPWEVTEDALRYNIEGERFEETVISLMTRQVGVDLNDLAWNGATAAPAATTLNGAFTAAATTVTLTSTTGFPDSGVLVIENERIAYTGKSGATLTGLTRGYDGTTAAAHVTTTPVTLAPDWLMTALDGWLAQSAATAHTVDVSGLGGGAMDKAVLQATLNAMPTRYLATASADRLRWIMHPRTAFAYFDSLTDHAASSGDAVLLGVGGRAPYGYPILEDPAMPTGTIVFTDPRNLLIGMALDIRVSRDASSKDVLSRGVRYYQIDLAADVKIEEADGMVVTTGIAD